MRPGLSIGSAGEMERKKSMKRCVPASAKELPPDLLQILLKSKEGLRQKHLRDSRLQEEDAARKETAMQPTPPWKTATANMSNTPVRDWVERRMARSHSVSRKLLLESKKIRPEDEHQNQPDSNIDVEKIDSENLKPSPFDRNMLSAAPHKKEALQNATNHERYSEIKPVDETKMKKVQQKVMHKRHRTPARAHPKPVLELVKFTSDVYFIKGTNKKVIVRTVNNVRMVRLGGNGWCKLDEHVDAE
jgi:hypothetical protein